MKFNVDDLVEQGLVKKKTYTEGKYKGLSVLKYSRKVFYDNLWHLDDRLLECRGIVVDEDDNIIVLPFRKVFNLGENNTTVDGDYEVVCPRKVNGYMLSVTYNNQYGWIVSTTGSLDSDFVHLGERWLNSTNKDALFEEGVTHIFEVCDSSDPHIVPEVAGMYLIGRRDHSTGELYQEKFLDGLAEVAKCKRPSLWVGKFKDLPVKVRHEGWVVRDYLTEVTLCKIKSVHYKSKKALQRCGKAKASKMWNTPQLFKQNLDEEFYEVFDKILNTFTQEEYLNLTEQERRKWIEDYFEEN